MFTHSSQVCQRKVGLPLVIDMISSMLDDMIVYVWWFGSGAVSAQNDSQLNSPILSDILTEPAPPPLPDRQHVSLSAEPCLDGFHTHCRFDALVSCLRVKLIQKMNQSYEQMCLYVSAPASWSYYRSWRESFFIIVVPSYIHTALDREEKQLSWTNGWMMWTRYRRLL